MTFKLGTGLYTGQIPSTSPRTFHQEYQDTLALVRLTEDEGLDSAWVSEHHGSADGYLPSLLPLLAAFAAVTERIELGTGVVLAPFHDPLRLAEDFAVVDQISGGRVIAGLALGWRDEEFRAFGIDPHTKVGRTIEISKILRLGVDRGPLRLRRQVLPLRGRRGNSEAGTCPASSYRWLRRCRDRASRADR